ncbi:hypothetical protein P152DRAFT_170870 [Eremomyces bilateralis CBS 781.70]|uniref:Uncharacterized protein n=1 Tax=Eremomyces bilateralis CBS 781.70 TaxID=1392243 RepID=A0A6G1FTL9_9PEZI|nr:uncharacterized protein P152DRAFT_170870 [Eremomyces bilateralis CBS 781.70]KAF1809147.1 hypothetical protein P152DRAFT_170870 [Eremomyces bilateralis CBS 781.70]
MPPVLGLLVDPNTFVSRAASPPNATVEALQVVCAWPVSDQYGPGSRVLYYVLVLACVLARKNEWLRNACLAAALLFPAVAAIHGIAIASLHIDGAIDLDVYGIFQLCSIGILAAPVTARLSTTYFNDPGRNIIFIWTSLILAGLISLMVEFYRQHESDCLDNLGNPVPMNTGSFPYEQHTCGLTCSTTEGPSSPFRGGSANEIYVIPAPSKVTFGTATLLAAACCIPAVLSLVSMWNKILKDNWLKLIYSDDQDETNENDLIQGTNGATLKDMEGINSVIRKFLSAIEAPFFVGAVGFVLIIGELNFFSQPMLYGIEPMACIGGWGPILAAGLAALGSLYVLHIPQSPPQQRNASDPKGLNGNGREVYTPDSESDTATGAADPTQDERHASIRRPPPRDQQTEMVEVERVRSGLSSGSDGPRSPTDLQANGRPHSTMDSDDHDRAHRLSMPSVDVGARKQVAKALNSVSDWFVTPAPDRYDYSEFKFGRAGMYPTVPGEASRNKQLRHTEEQYRALKGEEGAPTGLSRRASRISFAESGVASRSPSPSPSMRAPMQARIRTMSDPIEASRSTSDPSPGFQPRRRDTLQVPSPYPSPTRPTPAVVLTPSVPSSPTIVLSSPPDTASPADIPD